MADLNKKISVIIPVFNVQLYLRECLDSVCAQRISGLEILCIDDGSTDDSARILKEYSTEDDRIIVYNISNSGPGRARNYGIERASGDYIAFIDADDYILDVNSLENMISVCEANGVDICGSSRFKLFNGKVVPIDLKWPARSDVSPVLCYRDYQFDFHYQSYIYRAEFIDKHELRFPDYRRYQDPPFFVRAMYAAERFAIAQTDYYCYRAGHQAKLYTKRLICDLIAGLGDNLDFASKYHLDKLYTLTLERLNYDYFFQIINCETQDREEIVAALCRIAAMQPAQNLQLNALSYLQNLAPVENLTQRIEVILSNLGIKTVSIYGMGELGCLLLDFLRKTSLEVVFVIDKFLDIDLEIPVYGPEYVPEYSDIIIVTPFREFENVRKYMAGNGHKNLISLQHLIYCLANISSELSIWRK